MPDSTAADRPTCSIIAGSNGAGKTTCALPSGSHAPAWEQFPTLQRRVSITGRWSVRAAFPRWSVGTRAGLMHDLLTGKVPVNPDPPEPADA